MMATSKPLLNLIASENDNRAPSPHPTHLSVPGRLPNSKVIKDSTPGYQSAPFAGKEAQLDAVMDEIDHQGFIPENLIESETNVCTNMFVYILFFYFKN